MASFKHVYFFIAVLASCQTVAQMNALHIAEVTFADGEIKFRYARYLNEDQTEWVRHGLFTAFHKNGAKASELNYEHGLEDGESHDFHENGQLAAKGLYVKGKKHGLWKFYADDGS